MTEDDIIAALGVAEVNAEKASSSCSMCLAMAHMSDRVRPAVQAALEGKIGQRKLSKILGDAGYTVGVRSIAYHRSGHTKRPA